MNIVAAQSSDLAGIRWLLSSESLPIEDLTEATIQHFLVIRDGAGVIGAIGLELLGNVVLLRSLVVAWDHRNRGFGIALAEAAESLAHNSVRPRSICSLRRRRILCRARVPDRRARRRPCCDQGDG